MADGYTRAKAGNIGVCIGTSGPARTDMITGLYTAMADSVPILCITGQAPRAKLDRFAAAASSGFDAVEFMFPYEFDKGAIAEALAAHRLALALDNLPSGDWASGERGIACHPARVVEFRDGVERTTDYAKALRCPNLTFAAAALGEAGIELLLQTPPIARPRPSSLGRRTKL